MKKLILAFALTPFLCSASVVYNNTTSDTGFSAFFSTGPYTEIGDQLQLTGPSSLTSLTAQFYNGGSDATFDAVLRFYNVGVSVSSPVGSLIGGPFTVTNIFVAGSDTANVNFTNLGSLMAPQNIIVTLSVQNVSANGDFGVDFFDPPTVGSSSDEFYISNNGSGFSQASTLNNFDNLYLQINDATTSTVPEPASAALTLSAFGGILFLRRLYRRRA